jgi:hypothetical protein
MTEETRVEEELQRWATRRPTYVDCVLSFWEREESNFQLLSRVAKSIYAFPSSSAQIERDFGDAGRLVTKERASLKGYSVEMSSFVRANSEYVNIAQCDEIPMKELHKHIPCSKNAIPKFCRAFSLNAAHSTRQKKRRSFDLQPTISRHFGSEAAMLSRLILTALHIPHTRK